MMLKDLKLALGVARSVAAVTPLGKSAAEIYERFVAGGNGQLDFSAIIQTISSEGSYP